MIENIEASIKAKLSNIAKENKMSLEYITLRYMQEKLIKRLSISEYSDKFILKGGLLFLLFNIANPRVTRDIDFLGMNIENTEGRMKKVFKNILSVQLNDGLKYDLERIFSEKIKENANYEGIRLKFVCYLGKMRKNIQIDIGYGDKVYPSINKISYPSLLEEEIENVSVYSVETSIAEKFEAMIKLSYINSRMKDFYDIYIYITNNNIREVDIVNAIKLTFENRKTIIEENPVIFKDDFKNDQLKIKQWKAFFIKNNFEEIEFNKVLDSMERFFMHIIKCILSGKNKNLNWDFNKIEWIEKKLN